MRKIENNQYLIEIENGVITGFFEKDSVEKINLAGNLNLFGKAGFTLINDDITDQKKRVPYKAYKERVSEGVETESNEKSITVLDGKNNIDIIYRLTDGLIIEAATKNKDISQFGINLEFNFLGKVGTKFINQIMPTSPYTSLDKKFMYCIMTRLNGGFIVCAALEECDGWKIDYSSDYYGHYIENFMFLASFDKKYNGSNRKNLKIYIKTAKTLDEVYDILHYLYKVPYCTLLAGGNFNGTPYLKVSEDTDCLKVITPDGVDTMISVGDEKIIKLPAEEYGFYKVIPYTNGVSGIDACLWYCEDMRKLFDLSCMAIKKPYHCDDNLCEGGCFLWAMLLNMRLGGHYKFDELARKELSDVMGKNGVRIPRKTILPYATEKYAAYHIADSKRVQEQVFGVSILIDAYRLYKEEEYLEYAVAALNELIDNWVTKEGMLFNGEDYTTVCVPVIPIVDMAVLLSELNDERAEKFKKTAIKMAEFILKRGMKFPTEGTGEDSPSDAEDGSVSCTALSLLYVCANVHYDKRYIDFAGQVLELHKAWSIYSPDAKMNGSSFRWWETIWEGDGEGPAICAGHAWTIWKAEALYWYGMLTCNPKSITVDGITFSSAEIGEFKGKFKDVTHMKNSIIEFLRNY